MEFKKSMIIIVLAIFLLSIAGVCASDVNDNVVASEDIGRMALSQNDEISIMDDIQVIGQSNNEEKLTAGNMWYVNSSAENGAGTLENPFNNLNDTIYASSNNDIIMIASGTYAGEMNIHLIIDKNLTIERYGDGEAIFDGGNTYGIWEIRAKSINITGLTFQNGYGGNGGALSFKSELINSNINADFNNNQAMSSGGAIHFSEALTNVNITGNFTKNNAHGYSYDGEGGGAICFLGELDHVNIIGDFTDNIAQSFAGANYFKSKIANVNIYGNYKNNSAVEQNGGANWFMALENVTITSNFTDNIALGFGGANVFYEELKNVNISGNFINNTASWNNGGANQFKEKLTNVAITGDYSYNKAKQNGGANWFGDSKSLDNVNITGNYDHNEAGQDGGANRLGKPVNVNIIGNYTSNLAKNTGSWQGGGAIYVQNDPTKLTIAANFYNNSAVSQGAAVCFYNSMQNVEMTGNFINNTGKSVIYNYGASNSVIHDSIFLNNSKITCDGSGSLKIVDTWFGNNATDYNIAPGENKIDFDNWLFLNATVDTNDSDASKISNIVFKLYSYNSSGVSDYDNNHLNPINLTITATNGNVSKNIAELGESIQFTPTKGGTATVTAAVENTRHTVEIDVKGDFDLLQDLVNNESLSVINLERNYTYNEFDTITDGVKIKRTITINGNGYTIDAKGKSRIFNIGAYNVVIENLTLVNANFNGDGGAVYFDRSGRAINCTFVNNTASNGGAIYFAYGITGTVLNCTFVNNTASNGAAVYYGLGTVSTVENCTFVNNKANNWGGAIFFSSSYSAGTVENCNFTNNAAFNRGGAIYFNSKGNVSVSNFNNNSATNGGAIYFSNAISNSDINAIFINNTAERAGGAIYVEGDASNNNFISEFYNNTAKNASGGAIFFYNLAENNLFESIFEDNTALYGGGIFFYNEANKNRFNSDFRFNTAVSCGGAMFFADTTDHNNFTGKFINNSALGNITLVNGNGGAITFNGTSTNSIFTCDFINNTAKLYGGAVNYRKTPYNITFNSNFINNDAETGGGVNFFESMENVVFNGKFTDNYATYGGAIAAKSGVIENTFFKNNSAEKGGAIYFNESGRVINCNFTNNTATNDSGGAIWINSGVVENCNFTDNSVSNRGGAVFFNLYGEVTDCNFTDNSVSNRGGAVFFNRYGNVAGCIFTNNVADNNGGAIWMYSGNVSGCNFTNNQATDDYSYGGVIWLYSGNVSGCNFVNNSASFEGGAIRISSAGTVEKCNFTNNTAYRGGAVYFNDDGTVTDCNFTNNQATSGDGGAVYFNDGGTVTDCNFKNNTANYGGAVFFLNNGNVTNCNFVNNSASVYGGAIRMYSGSVENCNFTNNKATADDSWGGAVYIYSGAVENCNFTNNSAKYGGAVYFYDYGNATNCNFANNKATGDYNEGGAVWMYRGTVTNCNFTNNRASYSGGAVFFLNNGNVANCNFVNNSASNYGGAIGFSETGNVTNCNFTNNSARLGGAVNRYRNGDITNCNFVNNSASDYGGAIRMYFGTVENCNFTANIATAGSAIYFCSSSSTKTVSNSIFLNNKAKVDDTIPLNVIINENNIEIIFRGQNNLINAIYSLSEEVSFTNVTYWGAKGITNTDDSYPSRSNKEAGQNITINGFVNGNILNTVQTTDADGKIVLGNIGDYYITVRHDDDSYYTEAEAIFTNMKFYVNVTETKTTNKTVNITAKSNIPEHLFIDDKLIFILPNGLEINASYAAGGIWWAEHTFDDYADYQINASYIGLSNVTIINATISIVRANSTVNVSDVVLTYGETKNVTVTTEGATGVTAKINDTPVDVIDNYTIPISGLAAGNYTLTVTTIPDEDHAEVTKRVNITVNKAYTEIILSNETLYLKAGDVVSDIAKLTPGDAGDLTSLSSNEDIALAFEDTIYARVKGNVTVTVSFAGTENYTAAENKTITVFITPKDASVSVENETLDLKVDDKYEFNPAVNPSFLAVYYSSSNESVAVVTEYGLLRAVGEGTAVITLTVGNDQTYAINTTNVTVTVSLKDASVSVNNSTLDLFVGDTFTVVAVTVPDGMNVTFVPDDSGVYTVDDNGLVTALKEGTGNILVKVGDGEIYAYNSTNVTVTVSRIASDITMDTFDINVTDINATIINIHLPLFATGNVSLRINGDVSVVEINSTTVYTIPGGQVMHIENGGIPAGQYDVSATYNGDYRYSASTSNGTFTVSKLECEANFTQNDTIATAVLPENATGNVTLAIGNESLTSPVVNGTAVFNLSSVPAGDYNATLSYPGDETYSGFEVSVPVSIESKTHVEFANLTKRYHGPERFTVNVTDSKGRPEVNKTVQITINGVTYTKLTDENGTAGLNINLNSGEYPTSIIVNNETFNTTVTILATVNATDLKKVFRSDKKYFATFYDSEGNYLKNGTEVRFNINGVEYARSISGDEGIASLNINLEQGEYIITAINPVTGEMASNNITVIPRLIENTDIVKYYRNSTQYTVKVIDDDANPVGANVTVKFNINGVFYERATNESGIAKLNINLEPGDYIITAEYEGCMVSNNITVLPVLSADNLTKKEGAPDQFVAVLVNGTGNPYPNQNVTFNINGVFYDRITDSSGQVRLNINLMAGEYIITSSYNGANIANKITVTP